MMTEQEKQLLLADLCARSPYNVKISVDVNNLFIPRLKYIDGIICHFYECAWTEYIDKIKPYLRPMLSMSDGEKKEFHHVASLQRNYLGDDMFYTHWQMYDWLNAHHFDYRGLITKGLALEAPKEIL